MKRSTGVILFVLIISIVSGYLMSKASLIGKAGMSLFYKEYNFLKTWWKGGLLVFVTLMILYMLQGMVHKKYPSSKARTIYIIACIISFIGLYFTYNDFRHTLSHRLLGERFHLGVYLFWIGSIIINLSYLINTSATKSSFTQDRKMDSSLDKT